MRSAARTFAVTAWAAAVGAAISFWVAGEADGPGHAGPPGRRATSAGAGPDLATLRELSYLTTLRVELADAVVSELRGRTGGTTAVLLVRGEALLGVDLAAAETVSADAAARRVVLSLPAPSVQSARLDHSRTRLVQLWSDGLWVVTPGGGAADAAAVTGAYREAERAVTARADDAALRAAARRQAEGVVHAFARSAGWTVEVRWRP